MGVDSPSLDGGILHLAEDRGLFVTLELVGGNLMGVFCISLKTGVSL